MRKSLRLVSLQNQLDNPRILGVDANEKILAIGKCGVAFTISANSQRLRCISENTAFGSEESPSSKIALSPNTTTSNSPLP
jgi:hypothetical protein